MSDDRELTELAAKAAGIAGYWDIGCPAFVIGVDGVDSSRLVLFDPLHDDGDTLRLAVKLGMDLTLPEKREKVSSASLWYEGVLIHKMKWIDNEAPDSSFMEAVRRNVTGVAADVGKVMP